MHTAVYTRITARIIADLEQGVRPWLKPWSAANTTGRILRPLRWNGVPYQGINILTLWSEAVTRGYASSTWLTYRQAQELGGQVRRGETGSLVVYADRITRTEQDDTGQESETVIPLLRAYTVFNIEQIDGLPERFSTPPEPCRDPIERIAHAERFVAATGATIRHGGSLACYVMGRDEVRLPPFESFRDAESYYATLAHELTHWTRHPSRLDRDLGRKRFGDAGYAMEELVAELGSAFVCADLDLTPEPRPDHARYIASWLKVLRDDKRAIFIAASYGGVRPGPHLSRPQPARDTSICP
jgi:antirestriction protein ArdC